MGSFEEGIGPSQGLEQGNTKTKKKLDYLLDRNLAGCFALLLPPDYKLINDVKKNVFPPCTVHNTINITVSPYLENRFTINTVTLLFSDRQLFLRP